MKRSQLTLILLFALLILLGGFFLTQALISSHDSSSGSVPDDIKPIKLMMEDCIREVTKAGATELGFGSGTYEGDIPNYVDADGMHPVSEEQLKENLESYIKENIEFCDFQVFTDMGYTIAGKSDPEASVIFMYNGREIQVDLTYPLEIKKGDNIHTLDSYGVSVVHPLKFLYDVSVESLPIIYEYLSLGKPYSLIAEHTKKYNSFFMISDIDENLVMYAFIDKYNTTEEEVFLFYVEYPEKTPETVVFEDVGAIQGKVGYEVRYQIPTSINATFKDYTSLFDITEDGLIKFTPSAKDVGIHVVRLEAIYNGESQFKEVTVVIGTDNYPPFIGYIPTLHGEVGKKFEYQPYVTDKEDDTLFYSIEGIDGAAIDPLTGKISFFPTEAFEREVTVAVVDAQANTAKKSFTLVIK
jgi:hypothetical protein